jgi:hypothetical protein
MGGQKSLLYFHFKTLPVFLTFNFELIFSWYPALLFIGTNKLYIYDFLIILTIYQKKSCTRIGFKQSG